MKITNIFILLFLLSAFTIGVALEEGGREVTDIAIDNVSEVFYEIDLNNNQTNTSIPNLQGFFKVIEEGIQFIGIASLEVLRAGIYFGSDNPDYFEPEFIMNIMRLIIWLTIISLLIKPTFYLIIFIVMVVIYLKDVIRSRRSQEVVA